MQQVAKTLEYIPIHMCIRKYNTDIICIPMGCLQSSASERDLNPVICDSVSFSGDFISLTGNASNVLLLTELIIVDNENRARK